MSGKISAGQFLDAFRDQWKEAVEDNPEGIRRSYRNGKAWTGFMLADENALIRRLSERLSFDVGMEFQTLDCVYYRKKFRQKAGHEPFAAFLDVIIEHENGAGVEEEMWKLLFFHSPLKVLVFYDWDENEKVRGEKRGNWLSDRLTELLRMGSDFDAWWPEADDTEYLFLVGNRLEEGALPHWRHMTVRSSDFERRSQAPPAETLYRLRT